MFDRNLNRKRSAEGNLFAVALIDVILCFSALAHSDRSPIAVMKSMYAARDGALEVQPASNFWRDAPSVFFDGDNFGHLVSSLRTAVRSRWTDDSLYLLFICPYQSLNLKPFPQTKTKTDELWNWDVAEVFIGSDPAHIGRYKEFEISPQGEWIDLAIDVDLRQHNVDWHSGFATAATIDSAKKIWYGAMRIPFAALGSSPPAAGRDFRINLFRCEGVEPHRRLLAWQAPMGNSFHVPERFGRLELAK